MQTGKGNFMTNKVMAACLVALMGFGGFVSTATTSEAAGKGYCREVARDYANRKAGGKQILTGAAVGAGLGALTGAIVPGLKTGTGALIGAGVGTLGGGINANSKWKKYYNRRYAECRSW